MATENTSRNLSKIVPFQVEPDNEFERIREKWLIYFPLCYRSRVTFMTKQFTGSGIYEYSFVMNKLPMLAIISTGKVGTYLGILTAESNMSLFGLSVSVDLPSYIGVESLGTGVRLAAHIDCHMVLEACSSP